MSAPLSVPAEVRPPELIDVPTFMRAAVEADRPGLWNRLVAALADRDMTITCGALKGGTGKSTSAVYLALLLFALTGRRVLLVDADGTSQTTLDWSSMAADWPPEVIVMSWPVPDLARRVQAMRGDVGHVVIDTGGHSDEIFAQALLATDYLLVPVMPSKVELRRIPSTFAVARQVDSISPVLAQVMLVRITGGAKDLDMAEARRLFDAEDIPYMDSYVRHLKCYIRDVGHAVIDPADYVDILAELLEVDMEECD
jgi:chromosome partitioning protein